MIPVFLMIFIIGLCIGSFLNVLSYRITFDKPFLEPRSKCIFCNSQISWLDNIPLLSWLMLKGKCRYCKKPISPLYPFIEIITALIFTFLFIKIFIPFIFNNPKNILVDQFIIQEIINNSTWENIGLFSSYLILFSALIASVRSDLEAMVIPQIFSIWLVPLGMLCAYLSIIKIDLLESLIGAVLGYGILWSVAKVFYLLTNQEGLGVGDMELLAMIGSFLGASGVFISLLIGSLSGVSIGGIYLLISKKGKSTKIPFGPFLSLGATIYFFFDSYFTNIFF